MGKIPRGISFSQNFFSAMHPTMAATSNSGQSNALTTMKETSTMKAKLLTTIGCLLLMAGLVHSQTASLSLVNASNTTSGTYNPNDTFTLTLNATTSFNNANAFSAWLETNSGLAPFLKITNESYVTFPSPQDNGYPKTFSSSSGADPGFLTDTDTVINPQSGTIDGGDLGATGAPVNAGTFTLSTITFSLSGAPAGTYSLETTTGFGTNEKTSTIGDTSSTRHNVAAAVYTITVVPEPATLSLLALSGLGSFGLNVLRRRRG
jgi:hypothetical protein